jgi:branched-chain amino acid transport system substrate-binding protein
MADASPRRKCSRIAAACAPNPWNSKKVSYVFEVVASQFFLAEDMLQYMAKTYGVKSAALLYANVPFGVAGKGYLISKAHQYGIKLTKINDFTATEFTFSAQATKIASANPPGLFMWGSGAPSDGLVLKAVRAAGYKGPIVGDVTYGDAAIPSEAGSAATTVVGFSQINYVNPNNAATKKFITGYKTAYGSEPEFLSGATYDAVEVLAKAAKKAKKFTASALVWAMKGLKYKGITGDFKYTSSYRGGPGRTAYMPVAFTHGKYITPKKS